MSYNKLYSLLNNKIGLSVNTIGEETANGIIMNFIKEEDINSVEDLLLIFNNNKQLEDKFLNKFLINETWFLRDQKPFIFLKEYISNEYINKNNKVRILSLPCSTGEEVYSVSIILSEFENNNFSYSIDGIDLSKRAIEYARQGLFRKNSFRGTDEYFQKNYFTKKDDYFLLKDEYKRYINFSVGNILDNDLLNNNEKYDIIFCRNLLIYFDEQSRQIAKNKIDFLLKDNGLLFVGHAETILFNSDYKLLKEKGVFALQKTKAEEQKNGITSQNIKKEIKRSVPLEKESKDIPFFNTKYENNEIVKNDIIPTLNEAKLSADLAEYESALSICFEIEKNNGPTSENYNLQGVIYSALNNQNKAIEKFKKAIYLNPNDYESLVHLSLIYKKIGEDTQAKQLTKRFERLKEKNES